MYNNIVVDGHCDTLQKAFDEKLSIFNEKYSFNIKNALDTLPYIQFLASYINTKYDVKDTAYLRVNKMLDKFYTEYENNRDSITLIENRDDIEKLFNEHKVGILLTIENGSALSGDLSNIQRLYDRKIRVMSLTWNDDNFLGSGAFSKNDLGLTKAGYECVKIMNKIGMIIDVSHLSRKSFYNVFDTTINGVIATHSCADKLCNSPRNLTDDQIKLIAKSKGIIGVCFYREFLSNENIVTIDDILNHIEYISNLVGTEFVALGSDFDGMEKCDIPYGLNGIKNIRKIAEKLELRGFSKDEIYNIMGGNYIRVLKENLK